MSSRHSVTMMLMTIPPNAQAALCCFHMEGPSPWSSLKPHSPAQVHSLLWEVSYCMVIIVQWEETGSAIHVFFFF